MSTLDERVAFLEGKVEEHSRGFGELRDTVRQVDGHVLAVDQKLDRLVAGVSARIDALEGKVDRLGDRMNRQFLWLVSVQVAVLVAVIGALAGR